MNWPSPVFGRFQNGFNKVVIKLSGVQFWSEIISNRTRAARSFDQIALHSVQLPLYITGGRRNSYCIKYSENIMIYHYITEEEEILTALNILIIS